ncbi:hypothetical protein BV22DRAFT_274010 [Leucogyrophana mollusca]|uniref:Uncharacterized protein n=1 Tax=Leucogyrophana mollusca TaxID=85980 RepID=A0ACB8BP60_9AGAM|nr:hypothetical protein BV22DRAFT_274010 [Leucogyrophana mollusca]
MQCCLVMYCHSFTLLLISIQVVGIDLLPEISDAAGACEPCASFYVSPRYTECSSCSLQPSSYGNHFKVCHAPHRAKRLLQKHLKLKARLLVKRGSPSLVNQHRFLYVQCLPRTSLDLQIVSIPLSNTVRFSLRVGDSMSPRSPRTTARTVSRVASGRWAEWSMSAPPDGV